MVKKKTKLRPRRLFKDSKTGKFFYLINNKKKFINTGQIATQKQVSKINIQNIIPVPIRVKRIRKATEFKPITNERVVSRLVPIAPIPENLSTSRLFKGKDEKLEADKIKIEADKIKLEADKKKLEDDKKKLEDDKRKLEDEKRNTEDEKRKEVIDKRFKLLEEKEKKLEAKEKEINSKFKYIRKRGSSLEERLAELGRTTTGSLSSTDSDSTTGSLSSTDSERIPKPSIISRTPAPPISRSPEERSPKIIEEFLTEAYNPDVINEGDIGYEGESESKEEGVRGESKEEGVILPTATQGQIKRSLETFKTKINKGKPDAEKRNLTFEDYPEYFLFFTTSKTYKKYKPPKQDDMKQHPDFFESVEQEKKTREEMAKIAEERNANIVYSTTATNTGSGAYSNDDNGIYNDELQKIFADKTNKFLPVIPADKMYTLLPLVNKDTKKFAWIQNTENSGKMGRHWVAFFIDIPNLEVNYFDSLVENNGEPTKQYLKGLKKIIDKINPEYYLKLKTNSVMLQSPITNNCGYFALKFIMDRYRNIPFKTTTMYDKITGYDSDDDIIEGNKEGEKMIKKFKRYL